MIPRMAVAGYFYFDGQTRNGVVTDWNWAMAQWDKVATAKQAIRLVVVDFSYVYNIPPTASGPNTPNAADMKLKIAACRNAGQLVFGYVAGSGGAIPLHPPTSGGPWWFAPRAAAWPNPLTGNPYGVAQNTTKALMCVKDQIDIWQSTYPGIIDGIYVDEGPVDCLSNPYASSVPNNYRDYCNYIRQLNYQVFLLAAGYPDNDIANPGWFQALSWDFVGLWETPLPVYENSFGATDYCNSPNYPTIAPPSWWDPVNAGLPENRITRVHIVNNGVDAEAAATNATFTQVLTKIENLAVSRGSGTMWITETTTSTGGSVYGMLPDYWNDEVALFASTPAPAASWIQRSPSSSPPARFGASAAYYPPQGQVVLFGGESYQSGFADTWAWDGTNWTQLSPTSNPPGVLYGHIAFDVTRQVLVLWGGIAAGGSYPTDTWTWNGTTWTRITAAANPPGRSNGMMAWDGQRIILYGGETNNVRRADMWAWDGTNWSLLADPAAPGVRIGAIMKYLPSIQRVVLQGGSSDTQMLSDTWQWNGNSWTQYPVSVNPGARVDASAGFDGTRLLVFGGAQSAVVPLLFDLWAWDGTMWSAIPDRGPSARRLAAMAEYPSAPGIVLFGGDDNVNQRALGDTWTYGVPAPATKCVVVSTLFGELSPEVATLQSFRDRRLAKHSIGRILIDIYYRHGSKAATLVSKSRLLRTVVRSGIRASTALLQKLGV